MKRTQHALLIAAALLAGAAHAQSANDPLEPMNRAVFKFNDALDNAVLTPVAKGYQAVVPELVRTGIGNFFGNFSDGWSAINQLLQGKGEAAATMTMRVATNSLFGLGGLFDVASDLGMERQSEDFGQTLGRWGMPAGPYLVWPLLGPSTGRDTLARPLDLYWSPSLLVNDGGAIAGLSALQLIDTRANLLSASRVLDGIALDKYTFVRDAYIARRRNLVYDGNPPEVPEDKEPADPAQPVSAPPAAPK
jgi:phospholipid-binding lipoprotein MlaA